MKKKLIFATLFSGSSGNAVYISYGEDAILIDGGKNTKKITEALAQLGESAEKLRAVFVTHEHSDHIAALSVLSRKYRIPVHMNEHCYTALCNPPVSSEIHPPEYTVQVGPFTVSSFLTPHDSVCSVGYIIGVAGLTLGVATDMGMVAKSVVARLQGCQAALIECNYDEKMLWNGVYPLSLKERVAGKRGHLSNAEGAMLAAVLAYSGTERILLGHLSKENNTPEKAMEAVKGEFKKRNVTAYLAVADRDMPTVLLETEVEEPVQATAF